MKQVTLEIKIAAHGTEPDKNEKEIQMKLTDSIGNLLSEYLEENTEYRMLNMHTRLEIDDTEGTFVRAKNSTRNKNKENKPKDANEAFLQKLTNLIHDIKSIGDRECQCPSCREERTLN
jgi:hypothetical protein